MTHHPPPHHAKPTPEPTLPPPGSPTLEQWSAYEAAREAAHACGTPLITFIGPDRRTNAVVYEDCATGFLRVRHFK